MKSAVENLNPTRVKLTIEVPSDELQPYVDAALKQIGEQIQVPGFRKGKVPARLIEQRVGRATVIQEAVNEALPKFFGDAVDEHDVAPIGEPTVDVTEVPMEAGQQLAYTVEVDVRPEVTLPDYSTFEVTVDPVTVEDADIDERVELLRARFATLTGVERAVETGDVVTIDLKAVIDGEEIDAVEGITYEVGEGNMLPGMDEVLVGMNAGDTKDFVAPLAGGEHEGKDADCTITVQNVKVRELPEVDDDFAQMASEFDTVAEMREDLRSGAERDKKFEQGIQARDRVLEMLIEQTEVPLPESIVAAEVHSHLEGEDRLEDDEHRAEVEENTRKGLKTQFILDKLSEVEEIEVGQGELIEYLLMQAQQYNMDPNQFAQLLDQQGQIPAVLSEVGRRKALAAVLDKAKIVDTDGNTIDINDLVESPDEDVESLDADLDADADTDEVEVEADVDVQVSGDEEIASDESQAAAADEDIADTADAGSDQD